MFTVYKVTLSKTPELYVGPDFDEGTYIHRARLESIGTIDANDESTAMILARAKYPTGRKYGYAHLLERTN